MCPDTFDWITILLVEVVQYYFLIGGVNKNFNHLTTPT